MKVKKVFLAIMLAIVILLTSFSFVNAEGPSGQVKLVQTSKPSAGSYKPGDDIIIEVVFSATGMDGINEFQANIFEYDTTLLEYIGTEGVNGWKLFSDKNQIYLTRDDSNDCVGTLCKLKFKAKAEFENANVKLGEFDASSIKLIGLSSFDGNITEEVEYKIEPGEPEDPTPDNPDDPNTPDNPDDPNTPDNPDDPNTPDNPDDPNTPDNPDDPNTPDNPDDPNTPDNPDDSNKPENPDDSNKPENPDNSNKPGNSGNQNTNDGKGDVVPATKIPQTGQVGIAVFVVGLVLIALIMHKKYKKMKDIK